MEDSNPNKRRRGGQRQRVQQNEVENDPGTSSLFSFLMNMFAWGMFSPQQVQNIARLACEDMEKISNSAEFKDLKVLANLGAAGAHSNNMHRDLMQKFGSISKLPESFKSDIVFKTGTHQQEFLLPHEMFATFHAEYPNHWQQELVPSLEVLQEFWFAMREHPQMANHPLKARANFEVLAVPIGLHGDGVPITGRGKSWCKTMTTFSWSSLCAKGSTKTNRVWIWGVSDSLCQKNEIDGTLHQFLSILKWSLEWLWKGLWPDKPFNSDLPYPAGSEQKIKLLLLWLVATLAWCGGYWGIWTTWLQFWVCHTMEMLPTHARYANVHQLARTHGLTTDPQLVGLAHAGLQQTGSSGQAEVRILCSRYRG